MVEAVGVARLAVEGQEAGAFLVGEWTAIRARGEILERAEMARLGGDPVALYLENIGGGDFEVLADRLLHGLAGVVFLRFREVNLGEPPDLLLRGDGFILGAVGIEFRVGHIARVGALKPHEADVHPLRNGGRVVELAPESVELPPARLVEDEIGERGIVAEKPGHAVQARAQQASAEALFLFRVGIDARSFADVERIGKDGGEAGKLGLVADALRRIGRHSEIGIGDADAGQRHFVGRGRRGVRVDGAFARSGHGGRRGLDGSGLGDGLALDLQGGDIVTPAVFRHPPIFPEHEDL